LRAFFRAVAGWHRWFAVSGDGRGAARAVTGWSNLAFLFLVLSGVYLWVPRRWTRQHVRAILVPRWDARGRVRDFSWHHAFGVWMSVPLALVVASATVISFPWASDLAYRVRGEEPPARRAVGLARGAGAAGEGEAVEVAAFDARVLDGLVEWATSGSEAWRTVALTLPARAEGTIQVRVDEGWPGQPQMRHTLAYDAVTGAERSHVTFQDQTPGQRLRSYLRFLHTGEYYGLPGQTVAGLASLAGVVLVWTGIALAFRRMRSMWARARRA
jgi:uncharacterized iron-regulated membrane protein